MLRAGSHFGEMRKRWLGIRLRQQVADTLGSVSSAHAQPFPGLPSRILLLNLACISTEMLGLHIEFFVITFDFSFSIVCILRRGFVMEKIIIKHRFERSRLYTFNKGKVT